MSDTNSFGEQASFFRIADLQNAPIEGRFDAEHLKAIHRYIFKDSPDYRPGEYREDVPGQRYVKQRALEARPHHYHVHYQTEGIKAAVDGALNDFGDPKDLREHGRSLT